MDETDDESRRQWRVLVVDDHQLLASALVAAFEQDGRATVVGTCASLAEGVRCTAAASPDVVLTDRRLPDGDADQHIGSFIAASPRTRVLVMTGWATERSSIAALDAGARGIISKARPVDDIIDAVGRVAAGDLVLPAELASSLLVRGGKGGRSSRCHLSRRELDVLEALACGESTAQAALRLCISSNTLRNHLARAMLKLGCHSRMSAVAEAIRLGLVAPQLPGGDLAWAGAPCP
jgi:two-component system nitrate/nitrite response regulator NarL